MNGMKTKKLYHSEKSHFQDWVDQEDFRRKGCYMWKHGIENWQKDQRNIAYGK